jgi:predicted Zn-dependent peptidase
LPILAACLLALAAPTPLPAQASLEGRVREHTLANGMKFLLVERHESPTVSMYLRFKAGGVDEWTGVSGTAHLLEHMLFKGTPTLGTRDWEKEKPLLAEMETVGSALDREVLQGEKADAAEVARLRKRMEELQAEHKKYVLKDEIDEIYSKNGAVGFNAMTGKDNTTYVLSLPSNRLELWARIESERMLRPVLREFYSERDVVMEERRKSLESRPGGVLFEAFTGAAFLAHNYRIPTIGWASELQYLALEDVEKFRRTYYAPNNTIGAIVGDFDHAKTVVLLEKYFGPIPAQKLPRPLTTVEPEQKGERRVKVEFDANVQLLIGFHKPTMPSHDDYVMDLAQAVLSNGRTSRFYRNLVEGKQLAVGVSAGNGTPGARYANLFIISGTPRHPHTVAELEAAIYEELDKLGKTPVSARELQKVLNNAEADLIRGMDSNDGLASNLTYYEAVGGDWRYLVRYLENLKKLTPAELQACAAKYFVASNRTVAELVRPKAKPSEAQTPATTDAKAGPSAGKEK